MEEKDQPSMLCTEGTPEAASGDMDESDHSLPHSTPKVTNLFGYRSVENMESILLETSPMDESIYLGSDLQLDSSSSAITLVDGESLDDVSNTDHLNILGDIEKEVAEFTLQSEDEDQSKEPHVNIAPDGAAAQLKDNTEDNNLFVDINQPPADLSSYFKTDSQLESMTASEFFDALEPTSSPQESLVRPSLSDVEIKDNDVDLEIISPNLHKEEDIQVAFEEKKGDGMRPTPSTKNLSKFFTDGTINDAEGNSFFDMFTAAEGEEGTHPDSVSRQDSCQSTGSATLAPTTPPVASGLSLTASPLPSPLHQPSLLMDELPSSPPTHPFDMEQPLSIEQQPLSLDPPSLQGLGGDEDIFSASLHMSDIDRRHDAWIPCESTRQALIAIMTGLSGSNTPEPDQLTRPGIILDEPLGDPVKKLVQTFMGEQEAAKRNVPTADSVSQNEEGLRQLIRSECWRSAVDLTNYLLTQCGQGEGRVRQTSKNTPYTLQLWLCRISLLMKLRIYNQCESELAAFGNLDNPDLYYEFYPDSYPGRRGSMVPFELRILHAELPQFQGKSQESLDRLYYLLAVVTKMLNNMSSGLAEDGSALELNHNSRKASRALWEAREIRVLYCVGNCLMACKDYAASIEVFDSLLKKDESRQELLLCGMGRIALQMGDLKLAQRYFSRAEQLTDPTLPQSLCRNLINKGFLALGQNQFPRAHECFKQASEMEPTNAVAVNNAAVCALYMGQLKEALSSLEALVHKDPPRLLQDGLLFNLCTLYELESSRAMHKKQTLLDLVSRHKGNGFNAACLKMS